MRLRRPLEPGLGCLVGLNADDGLDALLPRLLVEVEDAVHVPVVGDTDGGLSVGHGGGDDLLDPGRPVEHGELSVKMEVSDRVAAAARTSHRSNLRVHKASTGPCGRVTTV